MGDNGTAFLNNRSLKDGCHKTMIFYYDLVPRLCPFYTFRFNSFSVICPAMCFCKMAVGRAKIAVGKGEETVKPFSFFFFFPAMPVLEISSLMCSCWTAWLFNVSLGWLIILFDHGKKGGREVK